jgi:hypothetical protein
VEFRDVRPAGRAGHQHRREQRPLADGAAARTGEWSRHSDLNRGPAVYETAALPLSYVGPDREYRRPFRQGVEGAPTIGRIPTSPRSRQISNACSTADIARHATPEREGSPTWAFPDTIGGERRARSIHVVDVASVTSLGARRSIETAGLGRLGPSHAEDRLQVRRWRSGEGVAHTAAISRDRPGGIGGTCTRFPISASPHHRVAFVSIVAADCASAVPAPSSRGSRARSDDSRR